MPHRKVVRSETARIRAFPPLPSRRDANKIHRTFEPLSLSSNTNPLILPQAILNDQGSTPTSSPAIHTTAPKMLPTTTIPPPSSEPLPPALQIKLLSPTAKPPTRGSAFAAGYDLYASKATTIPARGKALVDTDISIAVPAGTYGRVAPRSGLASKHSIDVGAGVIDADYRGPVKVLLFNFGEGAFDVGVGERVAQLIIERVSSSSCEMVWKGCSWLMTDLYA